MSREWKPGDVALVGYRLHGDDDLLQEDVRILRSDGKWYGATGWVTNHPEAAASIRPLVVIDPEDRADVERLHAAREEAITAEIARVGSAQTVDAMQAALRSLLAPPKPEEPLGLGAVVEDDGGRRWIRLDAADEPWSRCDPLSDSLVQSFAWSDLDVVRVLADGYTEGER